MKPMIIIRWILASFCGFYSLNLMSKGLRIDGFDAAPFLIISFASAISTVLLTSPEIAFKLAESFSGLFTGIFFPDEKFSKPPLSYLLARRYCLEMRTNDAIDEYANIIYYYPDERAAYLELISLAKSAGYKDVSTKYMSIFKQRFPNTSSEITDEVKSERP